ncbi:MAG: aspartate aminotransferase family protein [Actinomycetota bacterium]|nr:aspartate aminotransferase family protein [Actinomycetota bacterium]
MTLSLSDRALVQSYARYPVTFVSGSGCTLVDSDGHEYIDLLAGVGVCSVGHCHPDMVSAVSKQAARLMHVSNLYYTEPMMKLAERLSDSSLGGRVFFANSGAEANEAALKLVRKARPGGDVVVLHGAFHGRTYGALSATPQESKQAPFAPLVPGFKPVGAQADAISAAVDDTTAAVLLEPIQGEGGVHPLSDEVLVAAREACDRVGAALVFDEVQCGVGRTGTLWAFEQTPVKPDAMTLAKGLGGGLPIGALVTGPKLADVYAAGDHGSTFGGNVVVSAGANAVLDIIEDPSFLEQVQEHGIRLQEGLRDLPGVLSVRGRGLMVAAEVSSEAPELVRRALLEQRLVLNATGPSTVRFLPPLIISGEEIDEAVRRFGEVLAG